MYSTGIIRVVTSMRLGWMGHVARLRNTRNAHEILVAEPEGKRPLGRHIMEK
jgi:hypothetical protein